ncbi:transcription/translation regulatory transformer protein RfaH [Pseudomonas daroniae]|uniref:Transcription/translation regulatory transformer protein RfaH n=1 Tax=Phytopseudomonas daroniae TaxID=2487519 RepID=A0A4Q9QIJ6_9GAMM|nr:MULTISPECIES: transcription/translation regulatory transformer protein RfaH [Pseudomonas]TBU75739.1 transcription/translation regulatory transformer protein RfaH [Pseudomonas daroniae]TBU80534.1 transcription/translation regulatory transformer protein RfaH [Pseudomonas sp. FRB 228]TBU89641.1 transcription/translation regulatory transformer protein RfaH [Pseudomonas daroniae]
MNIDMKLSEIAWYLIQCKPRHDDKAWENLSRQGFECFCPRTRTQTIRAGKVKYSYQPLFPGYLFLHMKAQDNWAKLRSTRGVSRVVGFCGVPCRINDAIIEQLKKRSLQTEQAPMLNPGDNVHIKAGPLADMNAIFLTMDGEQRVMLLLRLLNREQQIKVPLSHLSALQA